jgi:hypothetical protein
MMPGNKKPFTKEQERIIEDNAMYMSILISILVVAVAFLLNWVIQPVPIDTDQLKAEIYQELGYEKVCVDYQYIQYACAEIQYYNGREWITDIQCPYPKGENNCTEWQWQPKEDT